MKLLGKGPRCKKNQQDWGHVFESRNRFETEWVPFLSSIPADSFWADFKFAPLTCVILALARRMQLDVDKDGYSFVHALMQVSKNSALGGMVSDRVTLVDRDSIPKLNIFFREAFYGVTHEWLMSRDYIDVLSILRNSTNAFRSMDQNENRRPFRIRWGDSNPQTKIGENVKSLLNGIFKNPPNTDNTNTEWENLKIHFNYMLIIQDSDIKKPDNYKSKTDVQIYNETLHGWFDNITKLLDHIEERWKDGKNAWYSDEELKSMAT